LAVGPNIPPLTRRVEDHASALTSNERDILEQELSAYERRTGHQFALLTVKTLDGTTIEDLAIRVTEQWRLGDKKRDDGLLVVLALTERRVRIEVGYGLEGVVTDAVSRQVIDNEMRPAFKRGAYSEGLKAGFDSLMAIAQGESSGPAVVQKTASEGRRGWITPAIFIIALLLLSAGRRRGGGLGGMIMLLPLLGGGGWSSGSRGGSSGGGFGGGGGGFGGGGASGDW